MAVTKGSAPLVSPGSCLGRRQRRNSTWVSTSASDSQAWLEDETWVGLLESGRFVVDEAAERK